MKSNPGGQIDTRAVIGRDALIGRLWDVLEGQSIVITAERRIGKTTVIKKMRDEPRSGWVPVFQDLERCHTAAEFAMAVYKEIHHFLNRGQRATRRVKELFQALGGTDVGGLFTLPDKAGPPWKDILSSAIEDLIHENDASAARLLFLWDEVPFMLSNIRDREGEHTAMEVLDQLRALRQTHSGLRMIITGSIGLHHVITSLKDKNYANAPTNDMASIDVPPLDPGDAAELAHRLLEGEGIAVTDGAVDTLAREADCFPFYIHHIVRALKLREKKASPEIVQRVVAEQLVDAADPWELLHYRERIRTYYPNQQKAVLQILDHLATAAAPASINDLLQACAALEDRELLLRLLTLMERDHYLKRNADGHFHFRFPLICRWWKLHRGV